MTAWLPPVQKCYAQHKLEQHKGAHTDCFISPCSEDSDRGLLTLDVHPGRPPHDPQMSAGTSSSKLPRLGCLFCFLALVQIGEGRSSRWANGPSGTRCLFSVPWRVPRMAVNSEQIPSKCRANSERASQTLYSLLILCKQSPWLADNKEPSQPLGSNWNEQFAKLNSFPCRRPWIKLYKAPCPAELSSIEPKQGSAGTPLLPFKLYELTDTSTFHCIPD